MLFYDDLIPKPLVKGGEMETVADPKTERPTTEPEVEIDPVQFQEDFFAGTRGLTRLVERNTLAIVHAAKQGNCRDVLKLAADMESNAQAIYALAGQYARYQSRSKPVTPPKTDV